MKPAPTASAADTAETGIPEDAVVKALNVPRSVVRELRASLTDGWTLGPGRMVVWSEAGIQALRQRLAAAAGAEAQPPAQDLVAEVQRIVLERTRFTNRRVMHGTVQGEPFDPREPEIVRVTDSGRFIPGMVVLARRVRHHVWEFEGNPEVPSAGRRYPRGVGVW